MGVSNAPLVVRRISNGHISTTTSRPIHFMYRPTTISDRSATICHRMSATLNSTGSQYIC